MLPSKPHVFLEYPQPRVLRVYAPLAPWIKVLVLLFSIGIIAGLFSAGAAAVIFCGFFFIPFVALFCAIVFTSKGYDTIIDLDRMVIEHRSGVFGRNQNNIISIDKEISVEISTDRGAVAVFATNAKPCILFSFIRTYFGNQRNRDIPVHFSADAWKLAEQITEWLNQNGVSAQMLCRSVRPYVLK